MVYYGDEVGMWGATDPDDRQPMIWKDLPPNDDPEVKFNQHLFDTYARLIAIRRQFATAADRLYPRRAGRRCAQHPGLQPRSRRLACVRAGKQKRRLPIGRSADRSGDRRLPRMIDWLDPAQAVVETAELRTPDGRPQIQPVPGVKPAVVTHNGRATISLQPWGAMILAPAGTN